MSVTMTRKRIPGIRPTDHTYARAGEDVRPGTLIGVVVRLGPHDHVLVGPDRVDLDSGTVTAWQVSRPGGGWIDGVSWPTIEQAVEVARTRINTLIEYTRVRDEAWLLHRRAADLDKRAAALLAAIEAGAQ